MSRCPGCGKTVYFAERQTGLDGKQWHRGCLIRYTADMSKRTSPFISYNEGEQTTAPTYQFSTPQQAVQNPTPVAVSKPPPVAVSKPPPVMSSSEAQNDQRQGEEEEFEVQVEFD